MIRNLSKRLLFSLDAGVTKGKPKVGIRAASTLQFDWRDALNLDSQLTDEEILMRDQVKAYCTDKLMPRILEANRHEKPDSNVLREMGQLGFLGPTIKGKNLYSSHR